MNALLDGYFMEDATLEDIEREIANGADVNERGKLRMTPIMYAARFTTDPKIINFLVQKVANVNAQDEIGRTALMRAAGKNPNIGVIRALLDEGADINLSNNEGKTALDYAKENRQLKNVENLIPKANRLLGGDFIRTATVEDIKKEIAKGADAKAIDKWGNTTLMNAATRNTNPEVFTELIKNGAAIKVKRRYGDTALFDATRRNKNPEVIDVLIKNGADVNDKNGNGFTVLMEAAKSNNPEVVTALIRNGADVNEITPLGWSVLMCGVKNMVTTFEGYPDIENFKSESFSSEIIEVLVKNGANINEKNKSGFTALMLAAKRYRKAKSIKTLIKMGANVNATNNYGQTALIYATFNSDPEIATVLATNGADMNAKDKDGKTVLIYAVSEKINSNWSEILRDDPEEKTMKPNPKFISFLLDNGADVQLTDNEGRTVLDYARMNKDLLGIEICERLEKLMLEKLLYDPG